MMKFKSPVVLVGEGELSQAELDAVAGGVFPLIAADGGANLLQEWGRYPHSIIGDMDSLKDPLHFKGHSQILHIQEQDSTDLEKCLNEVESSLFLALGFTGKRLDHTLEILHVMRKYHNKNIVFFSKEDSLFRLPLQFKAHLPVGTRVSLYPLEKTAPLGSVGLKYSLNGLQLEQGALIGTSNAVDNSPFEIWQTQAQLVGIFPLAHTGELIKNGFDPDWTKAFPHLLNLFT